MNCGLRVAQPTATVRDSASAFGKAQENVSVADVVEREFTAVASKANALRVGKEREKPVEDGRLSIGRTNGCG
jgi:hypothetical protein